MSNELYDELIQRVKAVNEATTEAGHNRADWELNAWREGVVACLGRDHLGWMIIAADLYYIDLDPNVGRPMCGGVFLDWEPSGVTT